MHVNHSVHSPGSSTARENALEEIINEDEAQLLIEALCQLRLTKQQALRLLQAEGLRPGGREFEPHDFGIPLIDRLLERLGAEPFEEPTDTDER